jgi:dihydroxyacetone kinase
MCTKHVFQSCEGLVLTLLQAVAFRHCVQRELTIRISVTFNQVVLTLYRHLASKSVYAANPCAALKISVLSGGGARHEPAHGRHVDNFRIFASLSSKQILSGTRFAAFAGENSTGRDVIAIINKYTCDRLNSV